MPLRDILVTLIVFGSLPWCFARPWFGVVMWFWIGYMNPHRLTWGFAHFYPFAQVIAIATLAGLLFTQDRRSVPKTLETYLLVLLWILFTLSTILAMFPELAWDLWEKVSKVFLFTFVAMVVCQERKRLRYLLLTIALSLGFYAVKGAFFVIRTGGTQQVQYPGGTSMGGNTGLGLALVMALPLFVFLAREEPNKWLRRLLRLMLICSVPSILFSYSRGAVLGLAAVALVLLFKANRKLLAVSSLVAGVLFINYFAPEAWFSRMETLKHYDEDRSTAMRLESWYVFYRVGLDHPLLGVGFWGPSEDTLYTTYVPNPLRAQNAHNSALNVFGEHGAIALAVWVALIGSCLWSCRSLRRARPGQPAPPTWVSNYAHMLEVSFIGYLACGFFLSAAYLEFFYNLVGLTVILKALAQREMESPRAVTPKPGASKPSVAVAVTPGPRHVRNFRPA